MLSIPDVALLATPVLSTVDTVPALVVGVVLAALASAMALTAFRRRDAD